ncbi:MAG: hypothetical protein ABIK23_07995 [candidate division WOR-3 bacterium]
MLISLLFFTTGVLEFNGQAGVQAEILSASGQVFYLANGEYRPKARLCWETGRNKFDIEASIRAVFQTIWHQESTSYQADISLYRAFARFLSKGNEVRVGLQQINFGSAILLRPLRWFDRLDPLDPLQTTEGVYALLYRYYLNNHSLWLWGLIGNSAPKGAELTPTVKWQPEAGGRLELSLPRGEIGLCFHHRQTEPFDSVKTVVPENKIGLDGRWDIGIGLWFEGMLLQRQNQWQQQVMLGSDYTFGIGNGLTLLFEQMASAGSSWFHHSALSLNYPLGLLDNLQLFALFDWQKRSPYIYLSWQRRWDRWLLGVAGFLKEKEMIGLISPRNADKGIMIQVMFNH